MKCIIAGGRDYTFTQHDYARLDEVRPKLPITEVVSGGATGADTCGQKWADIRNIPFTVFNAEWDDITVLGARIKTNRFGKQYNANAGFDRNEAMARYARAVILFPGGSGTADMYRRAVIHGLQILDWRR